MSGAFGAVPNTFANAVTATGLQLDQNFNTFTAYINDPTNRNNFAVAGGSTSTFAITLAPAPAAYSTGLEITFKTGVANAAAAVVDVNSLGSKNLVDQNGTALVVGAYPAGSMVKAVYDGTRFVSISAPYIWQGSAQNATKSTTFTWNGSGSTSTATILSMAKIGSFVTLNIPSVLATSGTNSTTLLSNTAIDAAYRPTATQTFPCNGMYNNGGGIASPGIIYINTNGTIQFYKDNTGATFTDSSSCGTNLATTVSYFTG